MITTRHRYLPFVQSLLLSAALCACSEESPEENKSPGTTTGRAEQGQDTEAKNEGASNEAGAGSDATAAAGATAADPSKHADDTAAHDDHTGAAGAAGGALAEGEAGAGGAFSSGPIVPPELPASFA